jgi:hypothetical protein
MLEFFPKLIIISAIACISVISINPVRAQIQNQNAESARNSSSNIQIAPGRSSAISFHDGETISYMLLSDSSRIVYTTNAAIESGKAQTIFLRQIQNIDLPGATRSPLPNLFVTTIDRSGIQHQYEFNLQLVKKATTQTRIVITPDNSIDTNMGLANVAQIERGLNRLLAAGKLSDSDPKVADVRKCLSLARNMSISEAARVTFVPDRVLQQLAEIGMQPSMQVGFSSNAR